MYSATCSFPLLGMEVYFRFNAVYRQMNSRPCPLILFTSLCMNTPLTLQLVPSYSLWEHQFSHNPANPKNDQFGFYQSDRWKTECHYLFPDE